MTLTDSGRVSLLPLIVAFKAVKAMLLTVLGVTLLFGIHSDPVDIVILIAQAVHLPLTSHVLDLALNLAVQVTPKQELSLAIAALGYAAVIGMEGIGLYLRRPWARWFTMGATASLLPIEIYEVARRPQKIRVVILLLNFAVVVYLWRRKDAFE